MQRHTPAAAGQAGNQAGAAAEGCMQVQSSAAGSSGHEQQAASAREDSIVARDAASCSTAGTSGQQQVLRTASEDAASSAGTAAGSRDRMDQQLPAAANMQFTPAQQGVIDGLVKALVKAATDSGSDVVHDARRVLVSNNPLTRCYLDLLQDDANLLSLEALERTESPKPSEALTLLAEQCAAAGCQPLEVFTRSLQCRTHLTALSRPAGQAEPQYLSQKQMRQISAMMDARQMLDALPQLGVRPGLDSLLINLLYLLAAMQLFAEPGALADGCHPSVGCCMSHIEHLFPGRRQAQHRC